MCRTVSIIIPVYNAEKYLIECLGNVVHQTLHDIEIILINDASTDGSLAIMRECEKQFPDKVKVIDSPVNLGAGGARNLGIEAAKGEYIGFVDSDDRIDITMYEKLYAKAKEENYDVVDCGYYKQSEDLAIIHVSDELTGILTIEKRKQMIVSGGYIVSKIFRRDLFQDTNLRFRNNVILEDSDFLTYLYATVARVGNVKEVLYFYRDNQISSSNVKAMDKYYYNICEAMQAIHNKMKMTLNYEDTKEAVEYELVQMYSYGVNICLKSYLQNPNENILEKLKQIARLKQAVAAEGYDNLYILAKMGRLDIEIMQRNDKSAEELLKWAKQQAGGKNSE